MRLSGHYSNHSSSLVGVLEAFPEGVLESAPRCRLEAEASKALRLGNGVVQRAVIKALALAARPLGVSEAQTSVEAALGHPVSKDSVNSCLSTGVRGAQPRFQRVAPGRYQFVRSPRGDGR